jgi:hypothetical protein
MTPVRAASIAAGALVALAISVPLHAQGKSQQSHGNGNGNGNNGGAKTASSQTPSQSTLPPPASLSGPTATAPFAWIDTATLMQPGTVWLALSFARWQGAGTSEVNLPVVDASVGLTPRVQLGVSVPRVSGSSDPSGTAGGLGTTFVNAKISVLQSEDYGMRVAIAPTVEILSRASVLAAPDGQGRAQWGLPVSVDFDRGAGRFYASTGYFSPGIWFGGAGLGALVHERVGVSLSFSRAWSSTASIDPAIVPPSRNDVSGGVSFDITPRIGVFGSIGRTIGTTEENGAGTTLSLGLSLTAARTSAEP